MQNHTTAMLVRGKLESWIGFDKGGQDKSGIVFIIFPMTVQILMDNDQVKKKEKRCYSFYSGFKTQTSPVTLTAL